MKKSSPRKRNTTSAYAASGVDIDTKMLALKQAKRLIQSTWNTSARSSWGSFGGGFQSPGKDSVLVSSIDGVGTKLKVAVMAGRHDTVGQDIVNHCVNDILVQGAAPLFFLDYIGASRLDPATISELIRGMAKACKANKCALIGGETAELPNLYPEGEYDLVGTIIGSVAKKDMITGSRIRSGDVMIGLHSSGCHTNGYSLARRAIFDLAGLTLTERIPGTKTSVERALLAVHRSYLNPIRETARTVNITGMAHITGGGFYDNIPRVLPDGLDAEIQLQSWTPPPLFRFIAETAKVDREEMYRVFNMGIGMIVFVRKAEADRAMKAFRKAGERPRIIGSVKKGRHQVRMIES